MDAVTIIIIGLLLLNFLLMLFKKPIEPVKFELKNELLKEQKNYCEFENVKTLSFWVLREQLRMENLNRDFEVSYNKDNGELKIQTK